MDRRKLLSLAFLVAGLVILCIIYLPLFKQEITYDIRQALPQKAQQQAEIVPPDPNFSIYIPKISALAPV